VWRGLAWDGWRGLQRECRARPRLRPNRPGARLLAVTVRARQDLRITYLRPPGRGGWNPEAQRSQTLPRQHESPGETGGPSTQTPPRGRVGTHSSGSHLFWVPRPATESQIQVPRPAAESQTAARNPSGARTAGLQGGSAARRAAPGNLAIACVERERAKASTESRGSTYPRSSPPPAHRVLARRHTQSQAH
jgi:hypothetical protein